MKRFSRLLCLLLCLCFAGCSAARTCFQQPARRTRFFSRQLLCLDH